MVTHIVWRIQFVTDIVCDAAIPLLARNLQTQWQQTLIDSHDSWLINLMTDTNCDSAIRFLTLNLHTWVAANRAGQSGSVCDMAARLGPRHLADLWALRSGIILKSSARYLYIYGTALHLEIFVCLYIYVWYICLYTHLEIYMSISPNVSSLLNPPCTTRLEIIDCLHIHLKICVSVYMCRCICL